MDKEGRRKRQRRGVKRGGDLYSGGGRLEDALDILADSVRFFHVYRHGENS